MEARPDTPRSFRANAGPRRTAFWSGQARKVAAAVIPSTEAAPKRTTKVSASTRAWIWAATSRVSAAVPEAPWTSPTSKGRRALVRAW